MLFNRAVLARTIADAFIPRNRNPLFSTHKGNPIFVRGIQGKVVVMHFNRYALRPQLPRNYVPSQIAVEK